MNRFSTTHLDQLSRGIKVSVPKDQEGFVGRECPNPDCLGYFTIKPRTGLKGENLPCHCPYCGHVAGHDHFWTQEQLAYMRSVMINEVQEALRQDVQDWDRELRRSTSNSFIKLSVSYRGEHHPVRYYREKELETRVICSECTLEYAIYGVFAYCPDCGAHNSLQILKKNLELAGKELILSENTSDGDLTAYLVADALENAVSAFDGFGREVCNLHASKATDPSKAESISFQNLHKARTTVTNLFGFDFAAGITMVEWDFACRCFQKRHLLAHKMGVIDQQYADLTGDTSAVVGRKVSIGLDEVKILIDTLARMGAALVRHFSGAGPTP